MKRFLLFFTMIIIAGFLPGLAGFAQEDSNSSKTESHEGFVVERDADVPDLPFEDNPDPTLCGIPEPWGEEGPAWLSGFYEGELIQDEVLLYDSHLRRSIVGNAPTGTEIEIILFQVNPSLNYYLVRTVGTDDIQEGWIPAPFVSFEKPL